MYDWALELFDEPSKRKMTGASYLSGHHLPTCLAYRAGSQTPAGCRLEGGWMILPTQCPVFLCVCSVHLEAATRRATSCLIPLLTLASIFGSQHSELVTVKSNIRLFFKCVAALYFRVYKNKQKNWYYLTWLGGFWISTLMINKGAVGIIGCIKSSHILFMLITLSLLYQDGADKTNKTGRKRTWEQRAF